MYLDLKNISVGYDTPLIQGAETSLDSGDICLLIGNNGVGKTTLIKSILNQTPLLSGEIRLESKNLTKLSATEIAKYIAVVFSKSPVPANFTLWDLVALGKFVHYPYYFELTEIHKKEVEEIIENLNLHQYRNFYLHQLSDGNLQKAFIGRALAQDTPMIILDEPTTHLDEENKIMILKLLRDLARKDNKLILFSSHDWRLAKEFADKMWLLYDGKIDAGITEEILLRHDSLLNPQIFEFEENFRPPQIIAPELHKEMLFSFLQKNFRQDLSEMKFEYRSSFWEISSPKMEEICASFQDIAEILQKHF